MLPKISSGVVTSVQKSMSQKGYLHDSWTEMVLENSNLFATITALCKSFPDKETKESFLRGAWLVWALFKSQDEADDMNEDWA